MACSGPFHKLTLDVYNCPRVCERGSADLNGTCACQKHFYGVPPGSHSPDADNRQIRQCGMHVVDGAATGWIARPE